MRPETLGPYTLGEPLGKGGMGTVYHATHGETGDVVAIKVLNPQLAVAEGFRDRFEGEIESLKSLRHAGIVRLLGYGEEEGVLFYAMELVQGPSLEEELRNGRRFNWRETTQIAIQVCRALKHAHDHGVIHRDIKPANILLGPNGVPKLADFGIARVFGSTGVTMAGGVLGTADYMSPEQASGTPVTARCDQYSLAGVMYALLTGRPPFRASDLPAMLQLQRFAIPEPVRRFAPDTPLDLERIVAQMLEKEPPQRFPNTEVVARRLEAMSQGLARVASDDFEVYQTRDTDESIDLMLADGLAHAETRDAVSTAPGGQPPPELLSGQATQPKSGITSYTSVAPQQERTDSGSPASAVAGQVVVLLIALGTLGGAAWWFMQPASADALYHRVQQSVREADTSTAATAAVREFAERFPEDPRVEEVEAWGSDLRLESLRKRMKLARRLGGYDERVSAEELLLRRASDVAVADPAEGAKAFSLLADWFGSGNDSDSLALAGLARNEAKRLAEVGSEQRTVLAEFAMETLTGSDPNEARDTAAAILLLLPDSPETESARSEAQALLDASDDEAP